MASPVDAGRAAYNGSTSAVTHNVTLPGSISAGDTLLMIFRVHNGTVGTGPSGWSTLVNNDASDASDDATSIFYKKADGSESGTVAVTLAGGLSRKASGITWRITGAADPTVTPPEASTVVTGATATPDPGNLAPSGGSQDYLWFWLGSWEGEQTSPPATGPTNYSNWTGANTGTAGNTDTNNRCAGGTRQLTASSEDPPSVTISVAAVGWSAWTVAVYPAGPSNTPINLNVALTLSPTVTRTSVSRNLSLALTLSPSVTRTTITRNLSLALTLVPTVTRTVTRNLSLALTLVPTVLRTVKRNLSLALTFAVSVTTFRLLNRVINVALTLTPTVTRTVKRNVSLTLTLAPTLTRTVSRLLSVPLTLSVALSRVVQRKLSVPLTFAVTVTRNIPIAISVALNFAVSVTATFVPASVPSTVRLTWKMTKDWMHRTTHRRIDP